MKHVFSYDEQNWAKPHALTAPLVAALSPPPETPFPSKLSEEIAAIKSILSSF